VAAQNRVNQATCQGRTQLDKLVLPLLNLIRDICDGPQREGAKPREAAITHRRRHRSRGIDSSFKKVVLDPR